MTPPKLNLRGWFWVAVVVVMGLGWWWLDRRHFLLLILAILFTACLRDGVSLFSYLYDNSPQKVSKIKLGMKENPYEPPKGSPRPHHNALALVLTGFISLAIGMLPTALAVVGWLFLWQYNVNGEMASDGRAFTVASTKFAGATWGLIAVAWAIYLRRRKKPLT